MYLETPDGIPLSVFPSAPQALLRLSVSVRSTAPLSTAFGVTCLRKLRRGPIKLTLMNTPAPILGVASLPQRTLATLQSHVLPHTGCKR